MALNAAWARKALRKLEPDPETGELYMTSLVEMAANEGKQVAAISITDPAEALGCDDFLSLADRRKALLSAPGCRADEKRRPLPRSGFGLRSRPTPRSAPAP